MFFSLLKYKEAEYKCPNVDTREEPILCSSVWFHTYLKNDRIILKDCLSYCSFYNDKNTSLCVKVALSILVLLSVGKESVLFGAIYFDYHHRWKQTDKYSWSPRGGKLVLSCFKL